MFIIQWISYLAKVSANNTVVIWRERDREKEREGAHLSLTLIYNSNTPDWSDRNMYNSFKVIKDDVIVHIVKDD